MVAARAHTHVKHSFMFVPDTGQKNRPTREGEAAGMEGGGAGDKPLGLPSQKGSSKRCR